MDPLTILIVFGIALSLAFAFTNGFNDAGADTATIVSSRAATIKGALLTASAANFLGALVGGSAVVFTLQGILTGEIAKDLGLAMFCAVVSAVGWNLISWYFGMPSSSTHALVGGLIGVGIGLNGLAGVNWGFDKLLNGEMVGVTKVLIFLVLAVIIGVVGGYIMMRVANLSLRRARKDINQKILKSQWLTTTLQTMSHGANDSQKQMAIIAVMMFSVGWTEEMSVGWDVRIVCALAMALGTLGGGYRIMRTVGLHIFKIRPIHALVAQTNTSLTVIISTFMGAPVSSTQVVTSSVMGVGAAENKKMVHWRVGKDLIVSWLLTIPVSMIMALILIIMLKGVI